MPVGYGCVCAQSNPILGNPMDCIPPGSSVCGILQAGKLEWVAISSSRGSSQPRDRTRISYVCCIGRCILYHPVSWKAPLDVYITHQAVTTKMSPHIVKHAGLTKSAPSWKPLLIIMTTWELSMCSIAAERGHQSLEVNSHLPCQLICFDSLGGTTLDKSGQRLPPRTNKGGAWVIWKVI